MQNNKITITINNSSADYSAWYTTAPDNFDGFGSFTAWDNKGISRLVLTRKGHEEWQVGRYKSENYEIRVASQDETASVIDKLWNNMTGALV